MEKIIDVAQFIFEEYKNMSGSSIDEMKLHKLLYLSQRECLAILGQPLFAETFEGWKYGPVSRAVRNEYTVDGIVSPTAQISMEAAYIVRNILSQYGIFESWELSRLTHKEKSWLKSRIGLSEGENGSRTIPIDDIREDAKRVRPYDSVWDMYYDEFDSVEVDES